MSWRRRSPEPAGRGRGRGETGSGLIAGVVGVAVFLVLLLLAVQVVLDLYARSAVTAAALDAASAVAGSDGNATSVAQADAVANARAILGSLGSGARFAWQVTPAAVKLTVTVGDPSVLPTFAASGLGLNHLSRSVVIGREMVRP